MAICRGNWLPAGCLSVRAFKFVCTAELGHLRVQVLEKVDEVLRSGDERGALTLVKDLQGKNGGLRCFGAARQVPQRIYTLEELKLNGIQTENFLSPVDVTLGGIERNIQILAVLGGISAWWAFDLTQLQLLFISVGFLFLWSWDLVAFNGGVKNLILDTIGHSFSKKYHNRVVQHEAGHFLIAYLLGILPKGYTLSSFEALVKEGSLNVQAGTTFVDYEFLEEVNSGKLSASSLNKFTCIALAGVATEYLLFGRAEGGLSDISQLDGLLKSLGFTQKKADSQVRWAVLNTVLVLRRHDAVRAALADAMSSNEPISACIEAIERAMGDSDV
ncbi:stress regulated protein [Wolffia australiana]